MKKHFLLIVGAILCLCPGRSKAQQPFDVAQLKARIAAYADSVGRQPDWLLSRLQMYWHTHATDVFINGESFSHVGGRAEAPTVKFNGTRGMESAYNSPRLEDVVPYDDDAEGRVTFVNKQTGQMEKAHPAKTGFNIAALNRRILGIARDAARIYSATADERYAAMAFGVFDTFMQGIYYRNVPYDLNHGHQQTLVGMTTFEVIHEDAVEETTEIYSRLRHYGPCAEQARLYEAAFSKWADNIIAGGVPHNNWDLYQADFIMRIALVLDKAERDRYLDTIVNRSTIRQWSLKKLADYGFDTQTGTWCESPGYSLGVIKAFTDLANRLDEQAGIDLFEQIPVLLDAVRTAPQYLMPNRMICGFGDTHPNYLELAPIDNVLKYARRHGNRQLIDEMEALRQAVRPEADEQSISKYVTPIFYAPNVSWLMQRTGMDKRHSLALSLNASLGNHQHANGISMELYGKGFVLGPDAGIGRYLYSGLDYAEYYSQFPAHNTVCVNGVSSYPVMMSQHAFDKQFASSTDQATCSQVSFKEPETQADQLRTTGIVTTPTGGYYIDIFRSRASGEKQFHDYFYHNLGQQMTLCAADGTDLNLQPTDELAFAGGHLYAYSYIYDKSSATTDSDIHATFATLCPDGRRVDMNLWMQGSTDREVFRALSPANLEYERLGDFMPYDVAQQPVLTFVARQRGDAWAKPFVAVYEPSDSDEPSEIQSVEFFSPRGRDAVGIKVTLKSGRQDIIVSTPDSYKLTIDGKTVLRRK